MPNAVLTTHTHCIMVEFNDLTPITKIVKGCWNRSFISKVVQRSDGAVEVVADGRSWVLDINGVLGLPIDTIDFVAPVDNSDIYQKISDLILS